jgi:peptidoglycan hydrolase-like protein with peptidoglycan-binding domain
MSFNKIPANFKIDDKSNVADLHKALERLNLSVADSEKRGKKLDASTTDAIKKFQKENKLKESGKLDDKTVSAMNAELHDNFITASKHRTEKLHSLLERLKLDVDKEETAKRRAGDSTRKAIKSFQKKNRMPVDGKLSEEVLNRLDETAIRERFTTNTQIGLLQAKLLKVNRIAGLKKEISAEELKNKVLGNTSRKLIEEFQKKYNLPATGDIDKPTLDKLDSIAASQGTLVKRISKPKADKLRSIDKPLRINKISPRVNDAQKALSFLGYKISAKEFNTQTFGKTTRKAVLEFQKKNGLAETGHLEKDEIKKLNSIIISSSPNAAASQSKYRIRGSVRDELWQRKPNMVIRIHEKLIEGENPEPLVSKKNFPNGFFDITYNPPINTNNGQVKEKFHLVVKLYEPAGDNPANDKLISSQTHYNVNRIHWVNFTEGDSPYRGDSDFAVTDKIVSKAIGNNTIYNLHETAGEKQISEMALQTGLTTDDIMRLILSYRVANSVNKLNILTPEVFYAFIRQNLPPNLPGDLLRATNDWETIDQLVEIAASGIIFTGEDLKIQTIDNAVSENLVSRMVKVNRLSILSELKNRQKNFILEKPILIGNQNLKTLLDNSEIKEQDYSAVAVTFIANKGINPGFWTELNEKAGEIGAEAIADFTSTVELGNISKNHIPTVQFFKNKIKTDAKFKTAASFAKLDTNEIAALIKTNGKSVPPNTPGNTADEKVNAYASIMKTRTELLFPAVSLAAEVRRSNSGSLTKIHEVESFLEANPELNFKQQNIDKYLLENNISLDDKTTEDLKVVQRSHKLSFDSVSGTALVDAGMHSSMQIYFAGKSRLIDLFAERGISDIQAAKVYEVAKVQYLQIMARLMEFRGETTADTPAAIISQSYSKAEIQAALGDIPNLEMLFGSLDFCECEHCKSLYSPAAYFTDTLRFISEHNSLVKKSPTKFFNVKEILFQRRPDLGNIKLNCDNTNTPLPYIDLVCEILENYVAPAQTNFSHQTTLSAKELRAAPQYIRTEAYEKIATSDYPMNSSFNLFQEEARTYLNYLRVPRFELMEAFQDISNPAAKVPDDVAVAAEYFGISAYEKNLIITSKKNVGTQNKYWEFDTTQTTVSVAEMMKRAKISYNELLELLLARYANPLNDRSKIVRPVDSCDTNEQQVDNLSIEKFDTWHRFIRLWRKTGWKMWELDLLLRYQKIGNSAINGQTLVNLKRFRQLQQKLNLPLETLLAFYGGINKEIRVQPDKPDVKINPLFKNLFQNITITNPIDSHFIGFDNNDNPIDLDATIILGVNNGAPHNGYTPVPTILSTLALTQADFDLLVGKTNNHLSNNSLSALYRYAYLARALNLSIKDLLLLLSITNTADPFASLQATADCIKNLELIKASNFSLLELDYILNYSPDSPVGLREETLVQLIESLRKTLSDNKAAIDKLNLSKANQTAILGFDADALPAKTDANLKADLLPLQNILTSVKTNFSDAGFSVEESSYIIQFTLLPTDTPDPVINAANKTKNDANKVKLVQNIKKLKDNLNGLLNQNQNQIKSQVASSFNLTDSQASILLDNLKLGNPAKTLLKTLEDETLIEKNPDQTYKKKINRTNFPAHFNAYSLLHKVALTALRLNISDDDLEWFIKNRNEAQSEAHTLDFSALPVTSAVTPDFIGWRNLFKFLDFKSNFPEPENASIRSILKLAENPATPTSVIRDEIVKLTQWNKDDLKTLEDKLHLQQLAADADYTDPEVYFRLKRCFDQMKLTGVNAETMFDWALIDNSLSHDKTVATQTRQAVKSKYEQDDWLQKITPLHDDIREKKRSALVEYHIEKSQRSEIDIIFFNGIMMPNPLYFKNSIDLYKFFLIDVEMSACQLTSRIKQAISSVQLFVQRCFLNLENRYVKVSEDEKADAASANAWSQWKWMKNYRIWEANRKIFFYPENWIEPELRDDKSPFFEELENELLQGEVTKENVEAAFLSYLHKVDEVSHLEVCGLYHEMENLSGDETMFEINVVHVIGRTKAIPHVYYYRTFDMNYGSWSAWSKIDVEIQGEQIVPVVYNRKLHLFWLMFVEKPIKTKKVPPPKQSASDDPKNAPEPMKQMEIQLGWTIKKSGGWTPKKISKQKLIHPWERPQYSYNLKPYYLSKLNELYLDIYLSTSKEFNDGYFYDPYQGKPVKVTKNPFNETFRPWHSASFVFDGEIKDVKLKGLGGHYHFEYHFMGFDIVIDEWTAADSYQYVHENFGVDGAEIKELNSTNEYGPRLKLPDGMHFKNTRLTNNRVHAVNNTAPRVLEGNVSTVLLTNAPSPFELVITQQDLQLNTVATNHPLFYQDNKRAFFVKPEWEAVLNNYGQVTNHTRKYRFLPFYHPYTMLFIREFNRDGIDGLMNRKIQTNPQSFPPANTFFFTPTYDPSSPVIVDDTSKKDVNDFSFGGAYSIYNWELFFHAPLMIACRLMQNQKFEDAMTWFHYIFNPTSIDNLPTPQRYWITKPFFEYNSDDYRKQRIENILSNINSSESEGQLIAWRNNPFKPHLIARYRPVAYQKNVVMKYLDNLIAWGDMLFGRDTIESINEASLLYMLAYEILGDRPQKVPNVNHDELTFNELEPKLDEFGNARIDVAIEDTLLPITVVPPTGDSEPIPKIETLYFCIPNNDFLTKYWDTVEDRLFKIRHCMNIQGIVRQLPLFEPPIDPALLVKAAAAGIDLSSVLNDLAAPTPHYRFRIVMQKAAEFCNEVKMLGEKLLNALERQDAEEIALLRSQNEIQLLEAVREVRKKQIDEAVEMIGSLNKTLEMAEAKKTFYENREFLNGAEVSGISLTMLALVAGNSAGMLQGIAGMLHLIPSFSIGIAGFGGSPNVSMSIGGGMFAAALQADAAKRSQVSSGLSQLATLSNTLGGYLRRQEEWSFQARLAAIEKDQIQFQISAAEIRQAIAEQELLNQEMQIENTKTVDDYMRNKFNNRQLFSWMITQISAVYFQAYQLAFEMSKKAEKCFRYELGITDSNYIQFGYWDSLKKGLLSGDKLINDLMRLEAAYIDQNKREFEITKHVSLAQMFPLSLITLKETGKCTISLPEWLFDMDYPGHYMRRIKNVSISVPCIVGPYTGVNCTLSLLKNETRISSVGNYAKVDENDDRFRSMFGSISSIATSGAQLDSGMFELNFNDDRYLPFEGAGAVSEWQIDMPIENNYFDFSSISDVILHISYTSRNGGGLLATGANTNLQTVLPNSTARLFSLKHEFGTEWYKFLHPENNGEQELVINLKAEHFPFFIRGKLNALKIKGLDLFIETAEAKDFITDIKVTNKNIMLGLNVSGDANFNGIHHLATPAALTADMPNALGEFKLKIKVSGITDFKSLAADKIKDIYLLLQLVK